MESITPSSWSPFCVVRSINNIQWDKIPGRKVCFLKGILAVSFKESVIPIEIVPVFLRSDILQIHHVRKK